MFEKKKDKTLFLAVLGAGLQAAGGICMLAAAVKTVGKTKQKAKQILLRELHRQLETV